MENLVITRDLFLIISLQTPRRPPVAKTRQTISKDLVKKSHIDKTDVKLLDRPASLKSYPVLKSNEKNENPGVTKC